MVRVNSSRLWWHSRQLERPPATLHASSCLCSHHRTPQFMPRPVHATSHLTSLATAVTHSSRQLEPSLGTFVPTRSDPGDTAHPTPSCLLATASTHSSHQLEPHPVAFAPARADPSDTTRPVFPQQPPPVPRGSRQL